MKRYEIRSSVSSTFDPIESRLFRFPPRSSHGEEETQARSASSSVVEHVKVEGEESGRTGYRQEPRGGGDWSGSRADRKYSLGNSARPIDFRAANDQYTRWRGATWGWRAKVFIVRERRGTRAPARARVSAHHRPTGRHEFWRVDASLCCLRLPPLCFRLFSPLRFSPCLRLCLSLSNARAISSPRVACRALHNSARRGGMYPCK